MCIPLYLRVVPLVLGAALAACGGGLTFPDDGSPASVRVESGNGQEGTVGSRLDDPLVVRVTDASSRPLAGVPVKFQFQTEAAEAEVDPTEATTDSEGRAAAQVRLGVDAGPYTVEALVVQPSASELRATFDLTAVEPEKRGKGKGGDGGQGGDDDDDDDDEDD
jgi:hypothetical protein